MSRDAPVLAMTPAKCVDWLAQDLRELSADPFRIITFVDGGNCTIPFHKMRDGESWLHPDLERYQEAVAVHDLTWQ